MKPIANWENVKAVQEGAFEVPKPGGYILKIVEVEDVPAKQYLKIGYDIETDEKADTKFRGYYHESHDSRGFDYPKFYRSYKESAQGFFKGFTDAVEASNKGYTFDWVESKLVGKCFGAVLGEEEYAGRDKENNPKLKTRLYVKTVCEVDKILSGDFKVPELKKLTEEQLANAGLSNKPSHSSFSTVGGGISAANVPF